MIDAKQIPDEVVEAARNAARDGPPTETWDEYWRAALTAALAAWPGAFHQTDEDGTWVSRPSVILPLPQKETSA